jgi:hypothetical protein
VGAADIMVTNLPRVECGCWVALVLANEVPGGEDSLDHVVDTGLLYLTVVDCGLELGAPVGVVVGKISAWHRHVKASVGTTSCGVLSC